LPVSGQIGVILIPFQREIIHSKPVNMKKVLLLSTAALLFAGVSFADHGKKGKKCCKKSSSSCCKSKSGGKSCSKDSKAEKM
jgi:hypothetical protein